jgi:hypothetical protein
MPFARPGASSLSIPIPTASLWRLRRPPTPRRATHQQPAYNDAPPVPALSFWDPETPSPLPPTLPLMLSRSVPLTRGTNTSTQEDPAMRCTSTASSWYCQIEGSSMPPEQAVTPIPPRKPRLVLPPPSPYSTTSPYSSTSPRSLLSHYSPISATSPASPHSPYNPYFSPPASRPTTKFFRLASPLLPASPLSIFDRAISPTSPTFLLSRPPSPGTSTQQFTSLRTVTPSIAERSTWDGLSPTFLWPRTPPVVPQRSTFLEHDNEAEEVQALQPRCPSASQPGLRPPTIVEQVECFRAEDVHRREMRIEFYHFLAAKRAAVLNRLSISPSDQSEEVRRVRGWKRLFPGSKVRDADDGSRRRKRFSVRSGIGYRA